MTTLHHRTRRTTPSATRSQYRRLAIIFICVVAIALLIVASVIEGTSPFLVFIPTLIAALMIARFTEK